MLATNREKLVMISVIGEIVSPQTQVDPLRVGHDGVARILPGTSGITYNVKVGDPALGWMGDHVEPGVTVKNSDSAANGGLQSLACVGNEARVVSGDAKGAVGVVTGTHGGAEHVICHFDGGTLEKLVIGDKIQVKAFGQGLELTGFREAKIKNLDPNLLEKMRVEGARGRLTVHVTTIVPPELMGSGIGATSERGDYDIVTNDAT